MFFKKNKVAALDVLPQHIAIIMDGNGRWASKRFLSKAAGHRAGAEALRKIIDASSDMGIKHLTVYAFSTENWKRSKDEVDSLMNLLREYLQQFIDDSNGTNNKIDVIGDISKLDSDLIEKIDYLQNKTKSCTKLNLHIALNYGSRDELARAVKKIAYQISKGTLQYDQITEDIIQKYLDTSNIPDPDILIRTSGEKRLSNFLLWQLSYSELYFVDKLWPDFSIDDLNMAILEFQKRNRRFGGRV